jgi:MFS family permease
MPNSGYKVYGYRWVVLAVFVLINLTIQTLWITFASITLPAAQFYRVGDLQIGLLAMVFMIAFIPLSLPVSWLIDTYGFYKTVSAGVILMSVFSILRGLLGGSYLPVLLCTIGLAISQPFMLNSWTKVAARWFPIQERATAVGLAAIANFTGTGIGLVLTPLLIESISIPSVLLIYGGAAALSAVLFILLAREAPPTPPCPPEQEERALMLDGLRSLVKSRPFWLLMFLFLIGNGTFNGISTWIESIVRPRGFSPAEAGVLGGVLLLGAVLGAAILPALSDRAHRRVPYLLVGMLGAVPGLLGLAFGQSYGLLIASVFSYGFFMVSTAPLGYQYAAELTYPVPEGTSNGMLTLAGQISVVFIYAMEALKSPDGSFTLSLLILVVLVVLNVVLITRMREAPLLVGNRSEPQPAGRSAGD